MLCTFFKEIPQISLSDGSDALPITIINGTEAIGQEDFINFIITYSKEDALSGQAKYLERKENNNSTYMNFTDTLNDYFKVYSYSSLHSVLELPLAVRYPLK